ncbi:carbohydrate ABC transporter substrate-binding protein (CUT1 family) [Kribbella amoyensis]|uniref:Carbohydrate ABC transporter substrate-binding protein (CUT1 family) n=1 Tax=Kribbella amoyensis TaxID=996641 RepID=A0A561BJD7_9ACTN|nr:extracellular solute-binding protein [Kribbella amoyensis]TWD78977.1 carbohydrate ABC transporter substrate-binding protein (CUT1 family) [Kribbella amoyensis]
MIPRSPRSTLRRFAAPAAATTLALGIAACGTTTGGGSTEDGAAVGEKATLTVVSQFGDNAALQPVLKKLNEEYQARHPEVSVNLQFLSADDEQKTLPTSLASGSGPDIFDYDAAESGLGELATNGLVAPLDKYADKYRWAEKMESTVLDRATYDGKRYGVPRSSEAVGLFYNRTLFAKYGVSAPTTYAAFLAAAEKLKAAGVTPVAFGNKDQWPSSHLIGAAIHANTPADTIRSLESLGGTATWGDATVRASMDLARSWVAKGYLTRNFNGVTFDDAFKSFYTGQAGMFVEGTGVTPDILQNASSPGDFAFVSFPMVASSLQQQAEGGVGGAWSISASSKAADIAADWIDFVHFSDTAEAAWLTAGVLPTSTFDTSKVDVAPLLQQNVDVVRAAQNGGGIGAWTGYTSSPLVTEAWNGAAQQFLDGSRDSATFAATLDDALSQARKKK